MTEPSVRQLIQRHALADQASALRQARLDPNTSTLEIAARELDLQQAFLTLDANQQAHVLRSVRVLPAATQLSIDALTRLLRSWQQPFLSRQAEKPPCNPAPSLKPFASGSPPSKNPSPPATAKPTPTNP